LEGNGDASGPVRGVTPADPGTPGSGEGPTGWFRSRRSLQVAVGLSAVAAAVGGAASGNHPTGSSGLDPAYASLLAALVALAASRASRAGLLVAAAIGVGFSRGWLWLPAAAALILAFAACFPKRSYPPLGALTGAVLAQVILRLPKLGFHGLSALTAALVSVVLCASAWRALSPRYRRMAAGGALALFGIAVILSVPVAISGLLARGAVDRGVAAAKSALADINKDSAPDAVNDLKVAAIDFSSAHTRTDRWWGWGGSLVPVVAQQRRAMVDVTGAGYRLAANASGEAGGIDFHDLTTHHGQINLTAVRALTRPVDALDSQIAAAQTVVSATQSEWLVQPIAAHFGKLDAQLAKARQAADLAAEAVRDSPQLLGGNGAERYLVVFMSPSETRGLGGLIGAYAELSVDQGRIKIIRSGPSPSLSVPPPAPSPILTGPAQYLARYGAFAPQRYFEDVTYSPDFPTVEDVVAQLYPQVGGDRIDGVMALDPYALAALLKFTGPITVSGLPQQLTNTNAAEILMRQQYIDVPSLDQQDARQSILQEALSVGFSRLLSGSLPAPNQLAAALSPEVRQGRLLFWTDETAVQPLLHRLGLEGAFPQPGRSSDVLAVTVANAAHNKIDTYLNESVSDQVTYDPQSGRVSAAVALSLDNQAPKSGLPVYLIGSPGGGDLPLGTNYMWLSVYSPFDLTYATLDGKVFPFDQGVAELGVTAYSAFLQIPSETTDTLHLSFDGYVAAGPTFRATVRLQPLANPQAVRISVLPTAGWRPRGGADGPWTAGTDEVQSHAWLFRR
jgi:uncharacterized protein DUF4012